MKLTIMVDFLLLKLNTTDQITHKEERLIWILVLEAGRPRAWHRCLVRAFLLCGDVRRHSKRVAPLTKPLMPRWEPHPHDLV